VQTTDKQAGRSGLARRCGLLLAAATLGLLGNVAVAQTTFPGNGEGPIPDATVNGTFGVPLDVTFPVSGVSGSLTNISVALIWAHTWVGDLDVVLAPPGVTPGNVGSFVIFSRVGAIDAPLSGDSSNINGAYRYQNAATLNIWTAAAAIGDDEDLAAGDYRTVAAGPAAIPAAATDFTAAFSGLTPAQINGTWTLRFRDRGLADVGSVNLANMTLTSGSGGGSISGTWLDLGPGPATNGQVEGITNKPVSGAVNAVAPHPSNSSIMYVGAVNGGIWRSNNATAAAPNWTRQTDAARSQSITALSFDPTDANRQTLIAGIGNNSSFAGIGNTLTGVLRTTDGGSTWVAVSGSPSLPNLLNKDVRAVAARGAILLAGSLQGLFRSTDSGVSFTQEQPGNGGFAFGRVSDLVGDPANNSLLYASVFGDGNPGVYRSTDTGATWTRVSDAATNTLFDTARHARLAVGPFANVFVAVIGADGRLSAVVRSPNGTTGWTDLGVPTTTEAGGFQFGVNPGGQGDIHLSIAADPTDSNIVYIGGDRQPASNEGTGNGAQFPNSLGAADYSGRLFRANASLAPASRWTALTHSGAGNNSSPHADSRGMAFDAAGELIEVDDGGIYKRGTPRTTTGAWTSLVNDLQVTEYQGIAYDGLADRVLGGAQDTGTTAQIDAVSKTFISISTGDGGDPVVDDTSSVTLSSRYTGFSGFAGYRRETYNASNVFQTRTFPAFTPTGGAPDIVGQSYTPIAVNKTNGLRLLIAGQNGLYESLDQGNSVARLSTIRVNDTSGDPLEYGVPGNAAFIFVAAGASVYLRTSGSGAPTLVSTPGNSIRDVTVDPAAPTRLFTLESTNVRFSTNSGGTFNDITGNLGSFQAGEFRSMLYVPRASGDTLIVGTDRGIYYALASGGFTTWQLLGAGLPNVPVYELAYNGSRDALIAGTLGRGAWRFNGVATGGGGGDAVFKNGFE